MDGLCHLQDLNGSAFVHDTFRSSTREHRVNQFAGLFVFIQNFHVSSKDDKKATIKTPDQFY